MKYRVTAADVDVEFFCAGDDGSAIERAIEMVQSWDYTGGDEPAEVPAFVERIDANGNYELIWDGMVAVEI